MFPTVAKKQNHWLFAISAWIGLTCLFVFIFAIFPELFAFSFLLVAVVIGWVLYWSGSENYSVFALWLWLITPEIRRLLDWYIGEMSSSTVMLMPYLFTAIAWLTPIKYVKSLQGDCGFPFLLAAVGVIYGFVVGVIKFGFFLSTFSLIQWIIPIGFGLHLALHWRRYPIMREKLHKFLVWGILFTACYAIVQFIFLPQWDRMWMQNVDMRSIGLPEPFLVRIFSTMNAPGPYAIFVMIGLIYMLGVFNSSKARKFAMILGYPIFLLTLVRSAWGGWLVGASLLAIRFSMRRGGKFFLILSSIALIVIGASLFEEGTANIINRISSFFHLKDDSSFLSRVEQYDQVSEDILSSPVGFGLGSFGGPGDSSEAEVIKRYGAFDSGVLEIPYVLGWVGGVLYLWALVWLTIQLAYGCCIRKDPYLYTYGVIVMALMSQLVFGPAHRGVSGVLLWGMIGMSMAGVKYIRSCGKY